MIDRATKSSNNSLVTVIYIVNILFWFIQAGFKVYVLKQPEQILWYSSAGLLLTTIAIYTENAFVMTSMFCALFVIEALWSLSLVTQILFGFNLFHITEYLFSPHYSVVRRIVSLYHFLIPISLVILVLKLRRVSLYGWIGAAIFGLFFAYASYFFPNNHSNVNCVFKETKDICSFFFSFLYRYDHFIGIFVGVSLLTIFIFLPTNIVLFLIKKQRTP